MLAWKSAGFASMVALLIAAPANASVIDSTNATPVFTINGSTIVNRVTAADFQLDSAATLTDVHFWTLESTALGNWFNNEDVEWFLWQGGTSPSGAAWQSGQALNIVRTAVSCGTGALANMNCIAWDFDLDSSVSLAANTTYWLGLYIRNWGENLATGNVSWARTSASAGSDDCATSTAGSNIDVATASWNVVSGTALCNSGKANFAFYLTGTVPEPGSAALLGLGLLGLGLVGRRKRP